MSDSTRERTDYAPEQFGYEQQFDRTVHRFASFAVGFAFISIVTGTFTTYGAVLSSSGPLGIWTWPIVIFGQTMVALVFGALAARIPLAGYSYQWMSRLANPYIGWILGWFIFAFLVVDVAAVDYALASTVLPALFGYSGTAVTAWLATAIIIAIQGILIMFSTVWTERVNNIGVGTEIAGVFGLTILVFVVGAFTGELDWSNLFSRGAVADTSWSDYFSFGSLTESGPWILGFLLGSFTIVGFEAASNLAEETDDPGRVVPRAMWSSVVVSGILGFAWLVAVTLASDNPVALANSATPIADVVIATLGQAVGKALLVLVVISIFVCGLVIFVTASRVSWAMSRDQRFPGWRILGNVNSRFATPLNAALAVGILIEIVLAAFATRTNVLFELFSAAALMPAIIYLSTVILYIATRRNLPGTQGFRLGRWEIPVVAIALVWLLFELSIFRDSSFFGPWAYVIAILGIGFVYFIWMLIQGRSFEMPSQVATTPEEELEETE